MSKSISLTPRRQSQSETDTDTSSRVSTASSSEQSSASEDDSEKSAQAPVMKTRQTRDTVPTTPAKHKTNSSAPSQATMKSSSPTVRNRQTGAQKRVRYGQARNLPAYQRDTDIKKIKTTKQGGTADILQVPKAENRWDQFTKAVTADGKLNVEIFDENEMNDFMAWLRTSPSSLRELCFHNSGMSRAHAIALAEVLRGNTTLIKLEVTGYLGEEGAAAIADALKVNATLTGLNLQGNDIGDEGAKALADALKFNTTLTKLEISSDLMGDEGAKALADALKTNKTLTKLDLFAYQITDEGEKAMLEALRVNEALTSLRFSPTLIGQFDTETSNLLERNRRLKLMPYAKASLDLLFRHSPELKDMDGFRDVLPLVGEHLSTEVMATFEQEWQDAFRAPAPPIITTTTNTTTTTTTATTTDATIPTILTTSPAVTSTDMAPVPPPVIEQTATAADIKALLADPNPVVAFSRWIYGHANPTAALNWVDPVNGYTLLHYAVVAQEGGVIRSLLARSIDRTRADQNNQTAEQLAQQRADSSSSQSVAAIAAMFKRE